MNPRKEIGCMVGVGPQINDDGDIEPCGDPVVAAWQWEEGVEPMYVCEKHDREMMDESEGNP